MVGWVIKSQLCNFSSCIYRHANTLCNAIPYRIIQYNKRVQHNESLLPLLTWKQYRHYQNLMLPPALNFCFCFAYGNYNTGGTCPVTPPRSVQVFAYMEQHKHLQTDVDEWIRGGIEWKSKKRKVKKILGGSGGAPPGKCWNLDANLCNLVHSGALISLKKWTEKDRIVTHNFLFFE